jgi:hypothetical protein
MGELLQSRFAALFVCMVGVCLLNACGGSNSTTPGIETGPLRVSGGGSGQFRERGADNSVEEYGHEASRSELEQAASEVHAYLVARAEKAWGAACAHSSEALKHRIEGVVEFSTEASGRPARTVPKGCAGMMGNLAPGEPPVADTPYKATTLIAGSLRVEGEVGFLFFNVHSEGRKLIVAREGGRWKPAGLLPTPLH